MVRTELFSLPNLRLETLTSTVKHIVFLRYIYEAVGTIMVP